MQTFPTLREAEDFELQNPNAFITVSGDEQYKERILKADQCSLLPLFLEIPHELFLSPVAVADFVPTAMYYGYSEVPYILLPVRSSLDESLVIPVWFLVDTGSYHTFIGESTRSFLSIPKEGQIFIYPSTKPCAYTSLTDNTKQVNILGRNYLWRGVLSFNKSANQISISQAFMLHIKK